jgi:transposase
MLDAAQRHADTDTRLRYKIIRNLARGVSVIAIHEILGCSRSQVYRVAHRFLEAGLCGLEDHRADNGQTKADDNFETHVLIAVYGSPQDYQFRRPTWTLELLVLVAKESTGVQVSCSTMSRLLARHGARRGRPKPFVECPWQKARKTRRLNEIRRLIENLPQNEVVLYLDEVDIHLNPKIGLDWMLSGQQKEVRTPGKNEKRYLCGALNARTGHVVWIAYTQKTGHLFLGLARELLRRYPWARRIHLVLDNYKIHKATYVNAALAEWGQRINLEFLPPYCPDHNRIERFWRDLHDNVTRNHRCASIDELMDEVEQYLQNRQRTGCHEYLRAG